MLHKAICTLPGHHCVWKRLAMSCCLTGQPCSVISQSSATVVCMPPSLPAGTYPINATIVGMGNAAGRLSLQYNLTTASFSPTLGSTYGGQLVTINGKQSGTGVMRATSMVTSGATALCE